MGESARQPGDITLRCVVLALLFLPLNAVYLIASEILWLTSAPTALSLFYNVVFILFWMVLANLAIKKYRPAWALQPGEFFVIYTMLCLASSLCSIDMLDVLIPALAHVHHFQPIEGQYEEVLNYLPDWLVVNDTTASNAFYLGQESIFEPAVFGPWLRPLFIWFWFILALFAVMAGLDLMFRKPWTEHEKLAYPIIQVPMLLVNETESLLRSRLFWTGFCAAGVVQLMNGINYYYPLWPKIPLVKVVDIVSLFPNRPWSDMGRTMVSFFPFAIALCFFMPLDLVFSCWFFYAVFKLQRVAASYIGVHGMSGFPYVEEQTCGGYYALALLALWISRRHLCRQLRLLAGAPVDRYEPGERAEARWAAVLIVGGGAFLLAFSLYHQMNLFISVFFFASYYLIAIAITRMRAELGYLSHDLHAIGPHFQVVKFIGQAEMGKRFPHDLTMFGFYHFITRAYRSHPMPHGMEAFRIAQQMKMRRGRYLLAMGVAVVAGTLVSYWAILYVFTKYGASNITGIGEWMGREPWQQFVHRWFTAPERHQPYPAYAIAAGLLFSLGLAVLRLNLAWWPLHPVGYAVSGSWSMDQLWMSFLTAWALKALLLRYGGAKAYRNIFPLLVGVILGDFIIGNTWTLYGLVTEQDVYHFWPY